jgi:acyl-ACP thioesterase
MDAVEPHREAFVVRSYEVDVRERLTVRALCGYLQEAARLHAASLGASTQALKALGLAWVLHRLRLELPGEPRLGDPLEVVTWPSRFDRAVASREFEVRDAQGGAMAAATSRWVIVDLRARRIVRLPDFVRALPALDRHALGLDARDLAAPAQAQAERRFEVRRSDIDATGHVNNTQYVAWILETAPGGLLDTHRPVGLEVEFRRESVYGDLVVSRAASRQGPDAGLAHSLELADRRELVRAVSVWRPV